MPAPGPERRKHGPGAGGPPPSAVKRSRQTEAGSRGRNWPWDASSIRSGCRLRDRPRGVSVDPVCSRQLPKSPRRLAPPPPPPGRPDSEWREKP
eukprot:scaffold4058_cov121-Isochrysis_galbana.AAC.2